MRRAEATVLPFNARKVRAVVELPARSGSFDCAARRCASRFAQDDKFGVGVGEGASAASLAVLVREVQPRMTDGWKARTEWWRGRSGWGRLQWSCRASVRSSVCPHIQTSPVQEFSYGDSGHADAPRHDYQVQQ
jgi:hypothetical protein